jgi:hypothetical protein
MALATALVAAALVACSTSSAPTLEAYTDTEERREYQIALNRSGDRVASNVPSVVDGRFYVAEHKKSADKFWQECTTHCATAVLVDGGYHVTLPVGFTYSEDSYLLTQHKDRYKAVPITKLTYWDPHTHGPKTVTATTLASVLAPKVLKYQGIKDLKEGGGGFVASYDIVETKQGLYVVDFAEMAREPDSPLYNSDDGLTVPVFKRDGKLIVCTRNNWVPVVYDDNPAYMDKLLRATTSATC